MGFMGILILNLGDIYLIKLIFNDFIHEIDKIRGCIEAV